MFRFLANLGPLGSGGRCLKNRSLQVHAGPSQPLASDGRRPFSAWARRLNSTGCGNTECPERAGRVFGTSSAEWAACVRRGDGTGTDDTGNRPVLHPSYPASRIVSLALVLLLLFAYAMSSARAQENLAAPTAPERIDAWIAELDHADFDRRQRAEKLLGKAGPAAVDALARACMSESPERRVRAARALTSARMAALRVALASPDPELRWAAWRRALNEGLPDGDSDLLGFLQDLGGKDYNAFFGDVIVSTTWLQAQRVALEHLRVTGTPQDLPAVFFAVEVDYRSPTASMLPWAALCQVGGAEAAEILEELKRRVGTDRPATDYLDQSVAFLKTKRHAGASDAAWPEPFVERCHRALAGRQPGEAAAALRTWWVAEMLDATGPRSEVLLPSDAQAKAWQYPVQVLGRARLNGAKKEAPPQLWPAFPLTNSVLLGDSRREVRLVACEMASEQPDRRLYDALLERLNDEREASDVRATAARALGMLMARGESESRADLLETLQKAGDPAVQRAAGFALILKPDCETGGLLRSAAEGSADPLTRAHLNLLSQRAEFLYERAHNDRDLTLDRLFGE